MLDPKMIQETPKALRREDSHDSDEVNRKLAPDLNYGLQNCHLTVRQLHEVIRVHGVHMRAAFDHLDN